MSLPGNEASDYMIEGKPLPFPVAIKFAISNILVYDTIRKTIFINVWRSVIIGVKIYEIIYAITICIDIGQT